MVALLSSLPIGSQRCRCPACGAIFSTVSNFDRHRAGKMDARYCRNPAKAGMTEKVTAAGVRVWVNMGHNSRSGQDFSRVRRKGRVG